MNTWDIAAYTALTQVYDNEMRVFPKVPLADLTVKFRPSKEQAMHWSKVQLRSIDFLICAGPELEPLLAITISKNHRPRGHDVIEDVLKDIGLPLLKLRAQDEYDRAEITRRVNLVIQEHQSAIATQQQEDSVLDTTMPSVDLDESSNSALSTTLRFLASLRDRYRIHADRTPADPPC